MELQEPVPETSKWARGKYHRLNIRPANRLVLTGGGAFTLGMGLGLVQGGRMAQLKFRAEHAHKMPTKAADWYFYHKSKNYHAMFGGLREGLKMGGKLGFWAMTLVWIEHAVDVYRGRRDLLSTVVASVAVSGGFSLWNRFPLTTTARTTKQALAFGVVFGGIQDVLSLIRGQPVGYVDSAQGWLRSRKLDGASEKT